MTYSPHLSGTSASPCAQPPRGKGRSALRPYFLAATAVWVLCVLSACASPRQAALTFAQQHGFAERLFVAQPFVLYGLYRPGSSARPDVLRVYIEGDGHAWESRTRPSGDPTPHNPVALRLAALDPGPDPVLYLARPCQYVQGKDRRHCAQRYWTSARLGQEVITALDAAITQARDACGARHVLLTGFSGGGGAAALLAAQRRDVVFLGTVAGMLDTDAWTRLQGISPLAGSLNPISVAPALRHMPQRHMSSRADAVMPPEISAAFCRAAGQAQSCEEVPGMAHGGPWQNIWHRYSAARRP